MDTPLLIDQLLPTALLIINVIRLLQCPSGLTAYENAVAVGADADGVYHVRDGFFWLRLPISRADAIALRAGDLAPKNTSASAPSTLGSSPAATFTITLASDPANKEKHKGSATKLRLKEVSVHDAPTIGGGGAANAHELVVYAQVENASGRACGKHSITVERRATPAVPATVHTACLSIVRPREQRKKRAASPLPLPPCKKCKQLEEQVASLDKMNTALRNDKAALRQENTALRNILDADLGGARADLGAVEHIEGVLGALAPAGDDDDDAGSGDDDEEDQTPPCDFDDVSSFDLAIFGDLMPAGAGAAPDATTDGGDGDDDR